MIYTVCGNGNIGQSKQKGLPQDKYSHLTMTDQPQLRSYFHTPFHPWGQKGKWHVIRQWWGCCIKQVSVNIRPRVYPSHLSRPSKLVFQTLSPQHSPRWCEDKCWETKVLQFPQREICHSLESIYTLPLTQDYYSCPGCSGLGMLAF